MSIENAILNRTSEWHDATYWGHNGTYEELSKKLEDMVPPSGPVADPENNRWLERFRLMSNAYYDIYQNGGGNVGRRASYYFKYAVPLAMAGRWADVAEITEPVMDRAVLKAAKEQGLINE